MAGGLYWVRHPALVWAPCSLGSGKVKFGVDPDGEKIEISVADILDIEEVRNEHLRGVDDICSMGVVTEGAMLHTIRVRYKRDEIYTRVARILIAINPFAPLPIYSSEYLHKYAEVGDSVDLPPHIFGIGKDAVSGLRAGLKDQAILISGESGAGKTESAKLVLAFITEASQGGGGCEDSILQTNPVLEAFGNAMTVRNNNSSRFGKWLDIRFSSAMSIVGCSVTSYLLEVTRVCSQAEGERNYHIFFMLLQARDSSEFGLSALNLGDAGSYRYLKDGCRSAPGIDDGKCFEDLKDAFAALGFSLERKKEVFQCLGAILTLGNCDFTTKGEVTCLADLATARSAAALMKVSPEGLEKCLLVRKLVVGREVTEKPLTEEEARAMRDACARLIYGRLFLWLIRKMNEVLVQSTGAGAADDEGRLLGSRLVGILDIAGFESFATNSLEQLLINLSNEHLQQQFTHTVFTSELAEYLEEDVNLAEDVAFVDNSDILQLIDGKGGILDILDDEGNMPKASDSTFIAKAAKAHKTQKRFIPPKFPGNPDFAISHYAGDVTYTCTNFLEKNKDSPPDDMVALLCTSSSELLRQCGEALKSESEDQNHAGRGKKHARSVASGYRLSLRSLMGKVRAATPHYIRCVKPNHSKEQGKFESDMVYNQILICGVLDAVRIRKQGFGSRIPYEEFILRYRCIASSLAKRPVDSFLGSTWQQPDTVARKLITILVEVLKDLNSNAFAFGKSKVFFKANAMPVLEIGRSLALVETAINVQRIFRRWKASKRAKEVRRIDGELRKWLQTASVFGEKSAVGSKAGGKVRLFASDVCACAMARHKSAEAMLATKTAGKILLDGAEKLSLRNGIVNEVKLTLNRMLQELECHDELQKLRTGLDPVVMGRELARARSIGLPTTEAEAEVDKRMTKLVAQLPLVRAMKVAIAAGSLDIEQVHETLEAVQEKGLRDSPNEWICELGGAELLAELLKSSNDAKAASDQELSDGEVMQARRKRTETITGLSLEGQSSLLESISAAAEECDCDALQQLIGEAVQQGVQDPEIDSAKQVFAELQGIPYVQEALEAAQVAVDVDVPPTAAVKLLQNLTKQLKKLQGDTQQSGDAERLVQAATRKRSAATRKRSVRFRAKTEEESILESQMNKEVFGSLANFPGLKPMSAWAGHRQSVHTSFHGPDHGSRPSAIVKPSDQIMLSHSRINIAESLTQLPALLDAQAQLNFRNIRVWMCDKPAQDVQRLASRDAVIGLAQREPRLRNEMHVQVMKQMTANPSPRSVLLGWQLFAELCKEGPPAPDLLDFVYAFLAQAAPIQKPEANKTQAPQRRPSLFASESSSLALRCLDALRCPSSQTAPCVRRPTIDKGPASLTAVSETKLRPPLESDGKGNEGAGPESLILEDKETEKPTVVLETKPRPQVEFDDAGDKSSGLKSPITKEPRKPTVVSEVKSCPVLKCDSAGNAGAGKGPEKSTGVLKIKSSPLLKFDGTGNEGARLAPEGLKLLESLPANCLICPVILIGDGRGGKSYLASRLLGVPDAFVSDNSAEPVTEGIDIIVAPVEPLLKAAGLSEVGSECEYLLLMDCEGGNNAMAAIRTLVNVFGIVIGTEVVFVAGGMASEQALQNLCASLAARALIKLDEHSDLPEQKLVFIVNMNTLRYQSNALEQILDAQYDGERGETRALIKGAFQERSFHPIGIMGTPDFEGSIDEWRRLALKQRSPLTIGGAPVGGSQLRGLFELLVSAIKNLNEVSFPSVQRHVIFDGFLLPIVAKLVAEVKARLPALDNYEPNIETKNPSSSTLKQFDAEVSHIRHQGFIDEARENLQEQLQELWKSTHYRNDVFGEEICETQTEYNEVVKSTQEGLLAPKGLLSRLRVTRKMCQVEARSLFTRKRGGEPVCGEWQSTGTTVTRFDESSLEGIGQLPRLQSRLRKRNPSVLEAILSLGTRVHVERVCMLRDGHFLWWEPGKENEPGDGGCINFFLQSATIETESGVVMEGSEEADRDASGCSWFKIKPAEATGWEDDSSFTRGSFRTFTLKGISGDDDIGGWIRGLRQHIAFCDKVREQLGRKRLEEQLSIRKYMLSEVG